MLVLARRSSERVILTNRETGEQISVMMCRSNKGQAWLGFDAAQGWEIAREELLQPPRAAEASTDGEEIDK